MVEALVKLQPSLASQRDSDGKLLLHIAARNGTVICDGCQKFKIWSILIALLKIYHVVAYTIDDNC